MGGFIAFIEALGADISIFLPEIIFYASGMTTLP